MSKIEYKFFSRGDQVPHEWYMTLPHIDEKDGSIPEGYIPGEMEFTCSVKTWREDGKVYIQAEEDTELVVAFTSGYNADFLAREAIEVRDQNGVWMVRWEPIKYDA